MSKRLVTYFSASGVTAKVAENLADAIGADIFEIQLKVSYTKADLNWMDKKVRSTIEMSDPASRPAIAAKRDNIAEYDTIFVGYSSVKYIKNPNFNLFFYIVEFKLVVIDLCHALKLVLIHAAIAIGFTRNMIFDVLFMLMVLCELINERFITTVCSQTLCTDKVYVLHFFF